MKKFVTVVLAFLVSGLFFVSFQNDTYAAKLKSDSDICFENFVRERTGHDNTDLTYQKRALYDEQLQQNGYEYTFTLGETQGFAFVTELQGTEENYYELEEIYLDKTSPFRNILIPIYITPLVYLEYRDSEFYDVISVSPVSNDMILQYVYTGFGYDSEAVDSVYAPQTVYFDHKESEEYYMPGTLPAYYNSTTNRNCCTNVAGAVILGVYDRFYPDLISNFASARTVAGRILYNAQNAEMDNVLYELYGGMETNVGGAGTTITGFKKGMQSYCGRRGRSISYETTMGGGQFDFQKYKTAIKQDKPIVIFMKQFNLIPLGTFEEQDGYQLIKLYQFDATHTMVCYGYLQDSFYNSSNQLIRQNTYLEVSSGLAGWGKGYVKINDYGSIMDSFIVNIY